jgi:hypothetical protein
MSTPKEAQLAQHFDAGDMHFVARALEIVETSTYDVLFPPLEGRKYVPVGPSVDPGAQSVTYRQYRRTGLAKLVTDDGQDLPNAGVSVQEFNRKLYQVGISYQYTNEELRAAALASRNGQSLSLDTERGAAARIAVDRAIDVILALGTATSTTIPGLSVGVGPDVGLVGLLNLASTSTYTPATGAAGSTSFSLKTPDEVIADLTGVVNSQISGTYKVHQPNKILLPIAQYQDIASRRMGDGSDSTILSFFKSIMPGVGIDSWQYCKAAGTAGVDRAVCFNTDPRYVRGTFAREFTQEPPQVSAMTTKIYCTAKLGGVVTPYPLSVTYMDGI